MDFNATFTTAYPMHALKVQQYSDLSYHLKFTPDCTLHSKVKDSITHISIVIFSSNFREDCYINVKCCSTILYKAIIFVMSYAEFSNFDFNGLDL